MTLRRLLGRWSLIAATSLVLALTLAAGARGAEPPVSVFPIAGSLVATPNTQLTFRGIAPGQLGPISVSGSRTGIHTGHLESDSDGNGASFLPATPFAPGELVTVRTSLNVVGGHGGSYSFTVASPAGSIPLGIRPTAARVPGDVDVFKSRRDLIPATVSVTQSSPSVAPGDIFLAPQFGPDQDGPTILDPSGNVVWFHPVPANEWATDFRVQTYKGQPVLTWWQGYVTGAGVGAGTGVIFDHDYRQIATVQAGNGLSADLHEFELTPQGTALITAYEPVYWDGSALPGGSRHEIVLDAVVQEIDIPTGLVLFQWDSLDHVPLTDTYSPLPKAGTRNPFDYFHVNAVQEDTDGNLIVSARNTWAAYKINHQTAATIWQIGGKGSTFSMGPGTQTAYQHHYRVRSAGLLSVFDDGGGPPQIRPARALLESFNEQTRKVTVVREFDHSPALHVNFEGSAQLLPDGDMFVGWGQQPFVTEFSPQGRQIFDAHFVGPNSSYRAFKFPWSAQPPTLPAIAAVQTTSGHAAVYASWNGATDVATWRVLAGARPNALAPVASAARSGFETAVPLTTSAPYVAAQALDAGGRTLATSDPVAVKSRVAVFGTTGFVSSSGVGGALVACFGAQPCTGSVTLTINGTVLGERQNVTIPAGQGGLVHITLNAQGLAQLSHAPGGQLPVRITVDDGGAAYTTSVINLVRFTTSGTPPATNATESPTIRTFASTAFAARQGVGAIFLGCFGSAACQGRLTITSGSTVIATRTETIGVDDGGVAHFTMTSAGQALLSHAAGNQLPVEVRVADSGGDVASATVNLVRFG